MTPQEQEQQRMMALQLANQIRSANAIAAREIKARPFHDALETVAGIVENNEAPMASMAIGRVLRTVPKLGTSRVRKILHAAGAWSEDRKVHQLTDRQRQLIADELRSHAMNYRGSRR